MTPTSSIARTLVYASLLICACSDGPTEPDTTEQGHLNPRAAQLNIGVFVFETRESGTDTLGVSATLFPGSSDGRLHRVLNDTLRVMGHALSPTPVLRGRALEYHGRFPVDGSAFSEIVEIISPVVEGVTPSQPQVRWSGVAKLGPDTLSVELGQGLVLPLDLPAESFFPEPDFTDWGVEISDDRNSARIDGRGIPPAMIPISENQLQVFSPGELEARFNWEVILVNPATPPDGSYIIVPAIAAFLRWVIVKETNAMTKRRNGQAWSS